MNDNGVDYKQAPLDSSIDDPEVASPS